MKESEETKTLPGAATQPPAKEPYVKPRIEVIELEPEQPVLTSSFDQWKPKPW